jgi:hypothetical protein
MKEIKRPVRHLPHLPLPAYAHRPGETPHPINHPDGHSRDSDIEVSGLPPGRWTAENAYLHGVDLYNNAFFWEAHEAWEAVWHGIGRRGVQAFFLKGLIQCSASLLHLHMGKHHPFERVSGRALGYLERVPEKLYMGLFLPGFLAEWCEFRIKNHLGKEAYPFIVLRYDE